MSSTLRISANLRALSVVLLALCLSCVSVSGATYNVLDYGAKGNGQTDDSAAFMACFKEAIADESGAATVLVPAYPSSSIRTYVLSEQVNVFGWCPVGNSFQLTFTGPDSAEVYLSFTGGFQITTDTFNPCQFNFVAENLVLLPTFQGATAFTSKEVNLVMTGTSLVINSTVGGSGFAFQSGVVNLNNVQVSSLYTVGTFQNTNLTVVNSTFSNCNSVINVVDGNTSLFSNTHVQNSQDFNIQYSDPYNADSVDMENNVCIHALGPNIVECTQHSTCNFRNNKCQGVPGAVKSKKNKAHH